jgi:geranylgeranyl diphosphate synthase type II
VGGQVRDLHPGQQDAAGLEVLHRAKTGALIEWATVAGAVLSGDAAGAAALGRAGRAIGLAFQITDDILDVVGDQAQMGKERGRDARQGKTTYLTFYGEEGARRMAAEQVQLAQDAASGPRGDALRALARFLLERDR